MIIEIANLSEKIEIQNDDEIGKHVLPGDMYTLLKDEMNQWYAREKQAGRTPKSDAFRARAEGLAENFVSLRPNETAKTIASKLLAKLDHDRSEARKIANQIEEAQKKKAEEKEKKKTGRERIAQILSSQLHLF